jgi:signal peptidase I
VLILIVGIFGTLLLGERWLAQRRAGRARRRSDAVLAISAGIVAVGTLWTGMLLLAGGGEIPTTADALRAAGQASVEPQGSGVDPVPVAGVTSDTPAIVRRAFAWPAPLPGATPFGIADLAVLGGLGAGLATWWRARQRPTAQPTRIDQGALALLATPGSPAVVQVAGWELRSTSGVFVVDATENDAIVIVGVGQVVATDGIGDPVVVPEGHGTTLSAYGGIGPIEEVPTAELERDPLLWSHGRREQVLEAAAVEAPRANPWRTRAAILAAATVTLVLALLMVNASLAQLVHVPSSSMAPSLQPGDRLLVDKTTHQLGAGDVIVFERPPNDRTSSELLLAKRIVAVGGQTVAIADGRVVVDGAPARGVPTTATCDDTDWLVPEGAVFVLGDARADSHDSRCFGPISTDLVVGRVRTRIWPPGAAGAIPAAPGN